MLYLFPQDIKSIEINPNDRPYTFLHVCYRLAYPRPLGPHFCSVCVQVDVLIVVLVNVVKYSPMIDILQFYTGVTIEYSQENTVLSFVSTLGPPFSLLLSVAYCDDRSLSIYSYDSF